LELRFGRSGNRPISAARHQFPFFSGTHGPLTLPKLEVWSYKDQRHWEKPISVTRSEPLRASPYEAQLNNFLAVMAGKETPVCSALDGLRALRLLWLCESLLVVGS
jgi:predicted dehydrogenase